MFTGDRGRLNSLRNKYTGRNTEVLLPLWQRCNRQGGAGLASQRDNFAKEASSPIALSRRKVSKMVGRNGPHKHCFLEDCETYSRRAETGSRDIFYMACTCGANMLTAKTSGTSQCRAKRSNRQQCPKLFGLGFHTSVHVFWQWHWLEKRNVRENSTGRSGEVLQETWAQSTAVGETK